MSETLMGSQEPSARIAPKYLTSDGPDAVKLLAVGGLIVDPWQANVLSDWMARTADGHWASPTSGLSVPRQNGKTLVVQGRAVAGMIFLNESIVYTAHLQKTATETFEELASFYDSRAFEKYIKDIKTALGREQIILKSGARIKFLARTRNGGRGQHGDLLIVDEAQEMDDSQQASFLPALAASLNPQTVYLGTPPDPTAVGTVFRKIRRGALAGETRRTSWTEFSVPEIGDVQDQKRWAATNPALGRRILVSTIETECESMAPDVFARERLGWWSPEVVQQDEHVLEAEKWDACASSELKPEGKTAYAVKFTPDGIGFALCGAVIPADGPARVSLINTGYTAQGLQVLADWLNARFKQASCVVIDGKNGVDVLIDKIASTWKAKDSIIRPRASDMIAATSTLTNAVDEHELTWYSKQTVLRESAVESVKRPINGGYAFGGEKAYIIEGCALALWGAKNTKRDPTRKMRIG